MELKAFEFSVGTSTLPGIPTIAGVADAATGRPIFSITASANAVRYELWVNQVGGATRALHDTQITTETYTSTTDLLAGTYRAWLRAFNADGIASGWSARFEFTV